MTKTAKVAMDGEVKEPMMVEAGNPAKVAGG